MSEIKGSRSQWPDYVAYALRYLGYEYPYDEEAIEKLQVRLGGLELDRIVQVLEEEPGEDRLFALFAVGAKDSPSVRALLAPFFESSQPKERWASALCLGEMKDERALPNLCEMITEYLPPNEQFTSEGYFEWHYDYWRTTVAGLLGTWERQTLVPILSAALKELWKQEQVAPSMKLLSIRSWQHSQDRITYALGQLKRFQLIIDVDTTENRRCLWMVLTALGHLRAAETYPDVFKRTVWNNIVLQEQVSKGLQDHFGLSKEEQEQCLRLATEEWLFR